MLALSTTYPTSAAFLRGWQLRARSLRIRPRCIFGWVFAPAEVSSLTVLGLSKNREPWFVPWLYHQIYQLMISSGKTMTTKQTKTWQLFFSTLKTLYNSWDDSPMLGHAVLRIASSFVNHRSCLNSQWHRLLHPAGVAGMGMQTSSVDRNLTELPSKPTHKSKHNNKSKT